MASAAPPPLWVQASLRRSRHQPVDAPVMVCPQFAPAMSFTDLGVQLYGGHHRGLRDELEMVRVSASGMGSASPRWVQVGSLGAVAEPMLRSMAVKHIRHVKYHVLDL